MKEDWYSKMYGPSAAKTYETSLFNLITTEFGYIGGPDVVKLFTRKIVELNNQYYLREEFVRTGQMRWLVLKGLWCKKSEYWSIFLVSHQKI